MPAGAPGSAQAAVHASHQVPNQAPSQAPNQAPSRASNDWVRMMLDYENERALGGRSGREAGTA